jgi:preprotein translocase subunit YajC
MGFLYGLASYALPVLAAPKSTATSATKPSAFQQYGLFILIAVMLVVFYLFLIRPQRKKATEHEDMLGSIKRGDEVVTIGGVHGTVKKITADTMEIDVGNDVRITFSKSAVSRKVTEDVEEEEETEEPGETPGDGDDTEE